MQKDVNTPNMIVPDDDKRLPLKMSGQQRATLDALLSKDPLLGRIYESALIVLLSDHNPDKFALAAHNLRELMEKLPQFIEVRLVAQRESLKGKVIELKDRWRSTLQTTRCYHDQSWQGEVDDPLSKLLVYIAGFFNWFEEHHPRRKQEIEDTLHGLDISGRRLPKRLVEPNVERWDGIRSFFLSIAHHGRETTRSEFNSWLHELEHVLLDLMCPRTFEDIAMIDSIIREGKPMLDPNIVKRALEQIRKRAVNYEYFFEHLSSPDWIKPLEEEGLFKEPPLPNREEDDISFPFWPESRYLVRMSSIAPKLVLEVALRIPDTENIRIHDDLADMALAMPADMAAKLVSKAKAGLESPYTLLLPQKLGNLMTHLARGGEVTAALDLVRDLLAVLPDPRTIEEGSLSEGSGLRSTPQPRFHLWEYGEILKNEIPQPVEVAGIQALCLLCDLLERALRLSEQPGRTKVSHDASFIWRADIAIDEEPRLDIRNLLVSAVRDASESLIENMGKEVLLIVEAQPFKVFQRIGLHLRRRWPAVDAEGTAELVQAKDVFDDIDLWHELFHLLREQFGNLPLKAQEGYLTLVDKGPETETRISNMKNRMGRVPTEEEIAVSVRRWQYKKLIPIQEYLQDEWRQRYETLSQEFGDIEHPDSHFYEHPVQWGPKSPKSSEELRAMTNDELVAFLASWRPSQDWMSPTPEGLGRMLQTVVAVSPESYAMHAEQFHSLDPTYVRGLLTGLEEAAKEHKSFPWHPVLRLCQWVLEQPREIPGRTSEYDDLDPDWGWTRKAIASLLSKGFESGTSEIPYPLRFTAWKVLQPLTEDPEPTPEYEAQYGDSSMDPATLSINTVRGEAMHATIRYALWVRRHEECLDQEEKCSQGFAAMPEVREVLNQHLEPVYDPSPAIRSVYGQWFPWLADIDPNWASENVPRIFPSDDALCRLRSAAWRAYVIFCRAYDSVLALLYEEYLSAIERIGCASQENLLANPEERLAQHLMVFYWLGHLDLEDPSGLIRQFYERANDPLCAYALSFVGRSLHGTQAQVPTNMVDRLDALWNYRLAVALDDPSSHIAEMAAFGWWFASAKFDSKWSIAQLKQVLSVTHEVEADHLVVEQLAALSSGLPLDCVDCLAALMENEPAWRLHTWREHSRQILMTALKSESGDARRAAVQLINRLGAKGYMQFRNLLADQSSSDWV